MSGRRTRFVSTDPTAHGLPRYDVEGMRRGLPPKVPWVTKPFAARGEVTLVYGVAGAMKSLFCLGVANGVATGRDFAGVPCKKGTAVYLDAENGEYEVHRRVRSLSVSRKNLAIYDASGIHLVEDYEKVEAAVAENRGATLVILDSLRRLLPGTEENDSSVMADALGVCKLLAQRLDVAVVVIHHAKKDGENYRGSSAIGDQASILYRFKAVDGDLDLSRRVLVNEKMRIAPVPRDRYFRLGIENGKCVSGPSHPPGEEDIIAAGTLRETVLGVRESLQDGEPRSQSEIARKLGRVPSDGTIRRALEVLRERREVERQPDKKWIIAKSPLPRQAESGKRKRGTSKAGSKS